MSSIAERIDKYAEEVRTKGEFGNYRMQLSLVEAMSIMRVMAQDIEQQNERISQLQDQVRSLADPHQRYE